MLGSRFMGISRRTALACGLSIALLGAGVIASPAQAAVAEATGNQWSIRVEIPDFTWDHYGCSEAPVTVTASGSPGEWWVTMPVRLTGSGKYTDTLIASGDAAGTVDETLDLCPSDLNGTYLVAGQAGGGNPESVLKLETSFVVNPMASATTLSGISTTSSRTHFTGAVTARSATLGTIGGKPGTSVQVQRQADDGWVDVAIGKLDNLGNFKLSTPRVYAAGTVFRAHYLGATEVASSTSDALKVPDAVPATPQVRSLVRAPGSARLTWKSQGSGVSYKYRITQPGGATYNAWIPTTKTYAIFPKLVRGAKYRFQVVAVNEAGTSKARTTFFRSR
jgi:hypothetical protein